MPPSNVPVTAVEPAPQVRGPELTFYERDYRLTFGVFQGRLSVSVFNVSREGDGPPKQVFVSRYPLHDDLVFVFRQNLRTIINAEPGTRLALGWQKWDPDTRELTLQFQLNVVKDKTGQFAIELQVPEKQYVANLGLHRNLLYRKPGSDTEATPAERGLTHLQRVAEWFANDCKIGQTVTNYKRVFVPAGGGQPDHGGGGAKMGGFTPPPGGFDDDIP